MIPGLPLVNSSYHSRGNLPNAKNPTGRIEFHLLSHLVSLSTVEASSTETTLRNTSDPHKSSPRTAETLGKARRNVYWEPTQSPTLSFSPPVSGCGQHSPPPHSHLMRCSSSSSVVGEVERTAGNQFTQLQFNCRSFCCCLLAPVTHPLLRDCSSFATSSPPPPHRVPSPQTIQLRV